MKKFIDVPIGRLLFYCDLHPGIEMFAANRCKDCFLTVEWEKARGDLDHQLEIVNECDSHIINQNDTRRP